MKKLLLLFLLVALQTFAQNKITFDFDYSIFAYDSTSNYVEIYYSVDKREFQPVLQTDSTFTIDGLLNVKIVSDETDSVIVDKLWGIKQPVNVTDTLDENQLLLGVLGFKVPEGSYSIDVSMSDKNDSTASRTFSEKFTVTPFISNSVKMSYIEIAKNIRQSNQKNSSIFYKNSYEVYPNPSLVFGYNVPVMFYYVELYNLDKSDKNMVLDKTLWNSKGRKVYERSRLVSNLNPSIVDVGMINLKNYPTDIYNLVITLRDTTTNSGALSSRKFYYYNPAFIDTSGNSIAGKDYIASEFGIMGNDELDIFFDECKVIATGDEIDQFEKLTTLDGKREFLYNFWKKRDPDTSTPENEFKEEYKKRIEFVEKRFGTMYKEGYKTDRGRTYLKYGEWDQIDMYPNPTNRKPYEIWYYNSIEGGVIFVFADMTGYSDYELLHSTKRGEIKDYDWQRRIIQN